MTHPLAAASPSCRGRLRPGGCDPVGMHRRRPSTVLLTGALLSASVLLNGCGEQPGTDEAASAGAAPSSVVETADTGSAGESGSTGQSSSTAPSASPAESGAGTAGQPFPGDTSPDHAEPVGAEGLTVTDVRMGGHEGFDRVVLDVGGQGTPGWTVDYVDGASAEGTGEPVDLAGPAYLRVVLTGISYPYETGLEERARGAVSAAGTGAVTGIWYDGTFEGQALAYVGTTAERPFRVYALSDPTRVVVEVATG